MANENNRTAIAHLAASEDGVFTSGQAARAGIPRYALSQAAKAGRIERIRHGAYRIASRMDDALDELRAAYKLTSPGSFTHERMGAGFDGVAVRGKSAAYALGIGDMRSEPWEIAVPRRFNSRMEDVRFRVAPLEREDVIWHGGLPVTKPERTIADLVADDMDDSLVADALADAVRRFGTTSFDIRRLRGLLGNERLNALLTAAGAYEGGPRELIEVDGLGHVALRER